MAKKSGEAAVTETAEMTEFDYKKAKSNSFWHNTWKHRAYLVMALPAVIIMLLFNYIPMTGLVLAFKKYDMTKGMFLSPWNGLDNFKFLIASKKTFFTMTRNTLLYYLIFTAIGTFLNVVIAIAIDQLVFKKFGKVMQTIMIIPVFVSYAAVQFIVMAYLGSNVGMISNALADAGQKIAFYRSPQYWPLILTLVKIWHDTGYGSVFTCQFLPVLILLFMKQLRSTAQPSGSRSNMFPCLLLFRWSRLCSFFPSAISCTRIPVFSSRSREIPETFTARRRLLIATFFTQSCIFPISDSWLQRHSSSLWSVCS